MMHGFSTLGRKRSSQNKCESLNFFFNPRLIQIIYVNLAFVFKYFQSVFKKNYLKMKRKLFFEEMQTEIFKCV